MKKILKKTYQWYLLYVILLTIGLLYFCFPSEAFKGYFINTVSRFHPHIRVTVEDARPSFTLGITFLNTRFLTKANPGMLLFAAEAITIRPSLWTVLGKGSGYSFSSYSYGGNIKGKVNFEKNNRPHPFDVIVDLKNIRLESCDSFARLVGQDSTGVLSGTITFEAQPDSLINGVGIAELKVMNGRVQLRKPLFNRESVDFDELQLKLAMKRRRVAISQLKLEGREIRGSLSGTIRLNREFMKSRLELDGTVEFYNATSNGAMDPLERGFPEETLMLPFGVYGTIENPEYRLS